MTAERWTTLAEIAAARARYESALPGWRVPAAFGLGIAAREPDDEHPETVFPVVNVGGAALSAVVLATVCGHRGGTATYELTPEQVAHALDLVAPAEACTDVPHPNMAAWRGIRNDLADVGDEVAYAVAVFVADLGDPVVDDHDDALRRAARTPQEL